MTLSQGDVDEAVLFAKVTVVAANYHIFTEVTQNFKSKDIFFKNLKSFSSLILRIGSMAPTSWPTRLLLLEGIEPILCTT